MKLSKQICDKFMALPEYATARTVMFYIDVRSEVRTCHALPEALNSGSASSYLGAMNMANWNFSASEHG